MPLFVVAGFVDGSDIVFVGVWWMRRGRRADFEVGGREGKANRWSELGIFPGLPIGEGKSEW